MNKISLIILSLLLVSMVEAQTTIEVMSFNIRLDVASDGENRWDIRKEKLAGLVRFYEPDFVGTQEVQDHQRTYLLDQLKNYEVIGVGRDDGKKEGEYSCIFYKKDKFKLISQSTFWLSPTPDSVSFGWNAACRRVCTYGLFQSIATRQFVWVFNTHFDHISAQAREESAKLIIRKINQLNTKNYPVVVTGDFNSKPTEAPALYMMSNMNNARQLSKLVYGGADTWNGFQFNKVPDGCIDYIFVSKSRKLSVQKFATLTDSYDMKYPSDHFPILATINMAK
ncbi:MAG: endonuclease/exonuclease/phosphatase family protein [Chitinophagaceae bacterium]|nr:MAG: endonuclease/exonuclease/phosphatase family protein [Chitinophagaceae bacterium]